jgi:small-conductance mechanosensitive channel
MNFSTFIQNSLSNIWVILALAAVIIILGWILGRLLSRIISNLLGKTNILNVVSGWLKLPNNSPVETWIRRVIRWGVFLLGLWIGGRILYSHPEIGLFLDGIWTFTVKTARLAVVAILFDLSLIALVTVLLFKAFGWVKSGFSVLSGRVEAERGKRVKGIKIQKLQLLSAKQATNFLLSVFKYTRYAVNVLLFLIYLTLVFSIFPQTRGVVNDLFANIFEMLNRGWKNFVDYIPSLFNLILIILVAIYGTKFIHFIFREIGKGSITITGFHTDWAEPTFQLVRVAVIALALVIAFPYLPGSSSPAFQGISIFIGALFSLGSTSVVGNIVAGIVLTYTRAFGIGDRVQIANTIGDVIDKGLLVTRVRTIKNVEVAIPNSMVLSSHIINYSLQAQARGLILHTTVTIGYDTPWRLMHDTLIQAALATPEILPDPRPFVLQTSLDDFYVSYELNAYTNQPQKMANIYSDLHQSIQDKCNEVGIEIMSPHYGALRDGNTSTIPVDQLPKDYQAPPFEVSLLKNKDK